MKEPVATILVIPCFNEELRIIEQDYLDFSLAHPQHLILFVNDGSTDKTKLLIEKLVSKRPNIQLY